MLTERIVKLPGRNGIPSGIVGFVRMLPIVIAITHAVDFEVSVPCQRVRRCSPSLHWDSMSTTAR
jgi:hypothetical protein